MRFPPFFERPFQSKRQEKPFEILPVFDDFSLLKTGKSN
jgi:hypothetical protein